LENIKALFTELYKDQLSPSRTTTKIDCPFDPYFDRRIQELENSTPAVVVTAPTVTVQEPDDESADVEPSSQINLSDSSRPASPASHILNGKTSSGPKGSRRSRKAATAASSAWNSTPGTSGDESSKKGKGAKPKKMRKWGADGMDIDADEAVLDFSEKPIAGAVSTPTQEINQKDWGTTTADGHFMLKDIGDEMNDILGAADEKKEQESKSSRFGAITGLFRNVIGGKTLTKEDLVQPLQAMQEHLIQKNVAIEAAATLCANISTELVGTKTASFKSKSYQYALYPTNTPYMHAYHLGVDAMIRPAMEKALRRMLTPSSPLDLLREIQLVKGKRPYVISIVGVNGVGKSTNLSKICFFLLQNKYRVLIAAGDTFRSGAVEQLRVHVTNLRELTERQQSGHVDIYERGYGKDAATIARDAVQFAAQNAFDVVLIDTAGRRHNDARLMSSLEKFAKLAQPDKILMVGEALVGTDSVSQARNFDAAFGPGRHLDGFIISKCDTVGDMVGTLVSMVYATGIPVLFLGTGQHYSDLRVLRAESVVELLMRN
jgi:signal recognition particle receptor subunit alpha